MSSTSRRSFLRFALVTAAATPLRAATGWSLQPVAALPVPRHDLQFRVDVDLVRLSVTARDSTDHIVHDLAREEFRVLEDGVEQGIAHFGHHQSPISAILLIDKSGSMADEKLMHAKDGVVAFVRALRPQDEALIIAFSDSIDTLDDFGLDPRSIERAVKRIDFEGGTRLYDAVTEASRAIAMPGRREKRAILILSDGADTASRVGLPEAIDAVRRAQIPVYAIGIELGGDPDSQWRRDALWRRVRGPWALEALERITNGTGGWTYRVEAARRCRDVCLRVADELRNQYVLGYYPTNSEEDGRWREIAVQATRPGVTLATREGYYAPTS